MPDRDIVNQAVIGESFIYSLILWDSGTGLPATGKVLGDVITAVLYPPPSGEESSPPIPLELDVGDWLERGTGVYDLIIDGEYITLSGTHTLAVQVDGCNWVIDRFISVEHSAFTYLDAIETTSSILAILSFGDWKIKEGKLEIYSPEGIANDEDPIARFSLWDNHNPPQPTSQYPYMRTVDFLPGPDPDDWTIIRTQSLYEF